MAPSFFKTLVARLLQHPTAPYYEHAVRSEAERFSDENGLLHERDRFGNLFVRLPGARASRSLVLAAHMDHPGFEMVHRISTRRWQARFRGTVPETYFKPGTPIRVMPNALPAKLGRRIAGADRLFELIFEREAEFIPEFAVWELEDCAFRGSRLYARGCDDVVGVAAVLAVLAELKRKRSRAPVLGFLSRAEEVGFHGALAAAAESSFSAAGTSSSARIPQDALVISLETSRELPGVKMGQGVIVRVGDKASIFNSDSSRFLSEVATGLKTSRPHFRFQRALMSGGTCEATAFQEFGFNSAAVCVPLGNYHNCGPKDRIRAEFVDVADVCSMIDLLAAAATLLPRYDQFTGRLPKRLQKLLREARRELPRTA